MNTRATELAKRFRLWLRGWAGFWRTVRQVRRKRHGVGAQPWPITFYLAACTRFILYGQHFPNSRSYQIIASRVAPGLAALKQEARDAEG